MIEKVSSLPTNLPIRLDAIHAAERQPISPSHSCDKNKSDRPPDIEFLVNPRTSNKHLLLLVLPNPFLAHPCLFLAVYVICSIYSSLV